MLQASPNCKGYELIRSDKDSQNYLLTIFWDSSDGHLEGFRKSDRFPGFLELIRTLHPDDPGDGALSFHRNVVAAWSIDGMGVSLGIGPVPKT